MLMWSGNLQEHPFGRLQNHVARQTFDVIIISRIHYYDDWHALPVPFNAIPSGMCVIISEPGV